MPKLLKIVFLAVGSGVACIALVAVAVVLFVDANDYKPELEAAASEALGMEVSVGGRLAIGFSPGLLVTLEDVHIRNRGADVASAQQARFWIELLPLLRREVRIGKIALRQSRISIERDLNGKFNFEKSVSSEATLPTLNLVNLSITDGILLYANKQSGEGFEAGNCRLDVQRLRLSGGKGADLMKNIFLAAELSCAEVRKNDFTMSDVKFSANGKNGLLTLKPLTMRVLGAQGSGDVQADFSGAVPLYRIRYVLPKFDIGKFFDTLAVQKIAEGFMDFSADVSMQGETVDEMRQTLAGQISLRGEKLTLSGYDLDGELVRFESSQNFNLVDAGAFFFAGPVGLLVTKGYDFANIFQSSGSSSEVQTLVADWNIERGVAWAQDVAMATNRNRIAIHGGLDLVNERFDNVTLALIDAEGCATMRQKIRGTFQKPSVDKPGILKSLAGPAFGLLKKGWELLPGGECEAFYRGSVPPPK